MSVDERRDQFLDAQADIYRRLGQALFEMLDPMYHHDWDEILLEVEQGQIQAQELQSIRVTATLIDGARLPLAASSEVIELCRRLDLLAKTQLGGKTWQTFSYRVFHGRVGPAYDCKYSYPEAVH